MNRRPWSALSAVPIGAALLIFLVLAFVPAPVAARSIEIARLDAELLVQRDGSLIVTERLQARFEGEWNGILRRLPVEYQAPGGLNYSLFVTVLGATDESGRELKTELKRSGAYLEVRIYVPNAADTRREVTLRYRVENALRYFEGYDELYWNVVGTEWDCPVLAGSARVLLPSGVRGLRAQAFQGPWGSTERAPADTTGNLVEARTDRDLALHEGLTVDVAWNPGLVARPTQLQRLGWLMRGNWGFAFPFLALGLMVVVWYRRGRDPRLRPIAPRYEAPDGLTAAEAGTLLDNTPDMRDITAVIVDLAVRGYIGIEEHETSHMLGLISNRDYVFRSRKQPTEWIELRPHERSLLDALFDTGTRDRVETSELVNHFYENLPRIKDSIFKELMERGYYGHRPDQVKAGYVIAGTIAALAIGFGGAKLAAHFGQQPVSFIIGGAVTWLIVLIFAQIMPARSLRGTRALEGVLGFQEFLSRVEGDRLQRVVKTPELFERCLPYAMAFGVETTWARAFDGIYKEPPSWYTGRHGGAFRATLFASDLGHMCGRTATAMASAPRGSSGSSGFGGGGGSSGGGFGGGGGGGF